MNEYTTKNTSTFLKNFIIENSLDVRKVAKEINCSFATLERIINKETLPTPNMIKQVGIMISIGFEKFKKLSKSEKEKISENIGAFGGGFIGFGAISSVVSASGSVAGLSAAGISSGLAAIGGTMAIGLLTITIIPIAAAGVGYGITKGVKNITLNHKLNKIEIDPYWEYLEK